MKKIKFKWKHMLLGGVGLSILGVFFAPLVQEKIGQLKTYLWIEDYKNKFAVPPEIERAKRLPPEASMTEVYKELYPLFNKELFNLVGQMEEELFSFIIGQQLNFSSTGEKANNYLSLGESDKAIALLEKKTRPELTRDEFALLGIAYLRQGEQQNCIDNHNHDSCLFPIKDLGIHRLQKGGAEALEIFQELLDLDPTRADWKWLLNISAMTIGKFPESVPERFRVNSEMMKSDIEFPRFLDVAKNVGILDASPGGSVIMDDFNNDGYLDIMNVSSIDEGFHNKLFINDGKGHFIDKTEHSGLLGIPTGLNMIQADYNNDGYLDVLILRGAWMASLGELPLSLLKNNGDGTFTEVTKEAGLFEFAPTQAAVWADFDNDGDLDLFVGYESSFIKKFKSKYYENLGNGKFKESSAEVGLDFSKYVKGVIATDYNNDGWEDLVITDLQNQKVILYKNMGIDQTTKKIHFKFDASLDAHAPFSIASFDYDNDGWPDLIVPGYEVDFSKAVSPFFAKKGENQVGVFKFFRNDHGVFKDVSTKLGLNISTMTMGMNYGDIDNDGFIDFYLGTGGPSFTKIVPNKMYRNNEGKNFQDITVAGGFGILQKGHGIAFGDYDNDGQVDVYSSLGGVYSSDYYQDALYHNPGNNNHWIKFKLHGIKSNRFGVGSKIKIITDKGTFWRHIDSGGSFGSNPLELQIGLGKSKKILEIQIFWPTMKTAQIFKNVAMDRFYEIIENSSTLKKMVLN